MNNIVNLVESIVSFGCNYWMEFEMRLKNDVKLVNDKMNGSSI